MLPLHWRVQYPGRLCAALVAGLGGRGWCRFLLLPLGSSLPLHPLWCVLRVVLPGYPFPSPAGTPFHAVCAFRRLGVVALRVRAACPLLVCALVLRRRSRPAPHPPVPCGARTSEAVPRTPWLGYGIQPVSGPLTPSTEGKTGLRSTNPMYGRRPLTPGASPAGACSVP